MKPLRFAAVTLFTSMLLAAGADAANQSAPVGAPVLDHPTLHSLGLHWVVQGDDNKNAAISLEYRKVGAPESERWRKAPPLWRVNKGTHKNKAGQSSVDVPGDAWLFAGSALLLEPKTEYDLKLTLSDPDGVTANAEQIGRQAKALEWRLKQATSSEPVEPAGMKTIHVVPGSGGGSGTKEDPYKGINAAFDAAIPGTIILMHKGSYDGPFVFRKSGEPGKPIIFRGAGDGEAIFDGKYPQDKLEGATVDIVGQSDLWFEEIGIVNAWNGIKAHGAQRIVFRRNHVREVNVGFFCSVNDPKVAEDFFITDNLFEGTVKWPATAEEWHVKEVRGVWVVGRGHVVAYNRIRNVEDAVDTGESMPCTAIDFHNNECSECVDDGSEMDGSERNTRNFLNRYTNALVALSFQPTYGGPIYVFKNVAYNYRTEATKLKVKATGMVLVHNTFVHMGNPWMCDTSAPVENCYSRNNIFVGTEGPAIYMSGKMIDCDFDHDGFGGWSGERFAKFNGNFATPEELKKKGTIEKHLTILDPKTLFASGLQPPTVNPKWDPKVPLGFGTVNLNTYPVEIVDVRLKEGSAAIGAGEVHEGFGDEPGSTPYLGAFAPGEKLPHYGPRAKE